jgi:vitamin B12 transporter
MAVSSSNRQDWEKQNLYHKKCFIDNMFDPKPVFRILMCAILMCVNNDLWGQTDTLKEVKIGARRNPSTDVKVNEFAPGQKIKTIDSATLQQYRLQSMASLLAQQEPVFVKSYGFNGLATLSFRGASSAQSEVLWNGVPIQNAALGIADVSTLPVLFMSKVNIVYGGSSALWGSGNVGGALMLENETPSFDSGSKTLSVSGGAGSFGQYSGGANGSISLRRWYFSANLFGQTAVNNFPYTDMTGAAQKMPNDRLQSAAALLQAAYTIGAQNTISLCVWGQQYDRQIPPALFESYSVKNETDRSLRLLADWKKVTANSTWHAKSSLIRDDVNYSDASIELQTKNTAYQYYQETGWKKNLYEFGELLLFVPVQVSWMNVAPNDTKQQDKAAIARAETINGLGVLLPGADASFTITSWLTLRTNAQRTYRAPSLNELYYDPGGNPGLKPEQGWNEDAGYTVKAKIGNLSFYHDLSAFNRDIHDWILWLGGAIWTPHNIAQVHSRGIETENNISYTLGKWKLHLGLNTAYILSTTVASYLPNDGSIGMQIPYTPRYNGQVNIGFSYKQLTASYNETYTGYRFITSDESEYLTPYYTGNVLLMYNTGIDKHNLQLTAQCNNLWNEQYQVVAGRPMPGINWLAGFRIGIL